MPSSPPPSAAHLHDLARVLLAADIPRPYAVGVEHLGTEPELVLRPLTADAPVASLLGTRAPAHWLAVGVVAAGDARPLHDGAGAGPALSLAWSGPLARVARGHRGVAIVYLVDRSGGEVGLLQVLADGAPVGEPYDTGGGGGRIPDVCRRVLGVPTPAPTEPVTELWCLDWLDRMVEAVVGRDLGSPVPTWPQLAALWRGAPPDELPWAIVRRRVADGSLSVTGIAPRLAAWMDDGMFSREALASFPDRHELLLDLTELLPPRTMAAVLATLNTASWPDVA